MQHAVLHMMKSIAAGVRAGSSAHKSTMCHRCLGIYGRCSNATVLTVCWPLSSSCTGDTIVFERRGDERSVIYVTVVKACDAPVEPEPKKRRVSRKQAVQCLG